MENKKMPMDQLVEAYGLSLVDIFARVNFAYYIDPES